MKKHVDKCKAALAKGLSRFASGVAVVAMVGSSAQTWAQVVQVPSGCIVRVAGSGGTLGGFPTGFVGDGGVVEMPDPYAGGNFVLSGATPIGWNLLGDISEQTANVPPAAPDQSAGALATVNIESYNKELRLSETGTPSTNARSKGRVTIRYTISPCNAVMSFDILKNWGNPATITTGVDFAPPIVGPNCWPGTNQLVTFSVDQVSSDNGLDAIGFDQYYWQILNRAATPADLVSVGGVTYTSADRSSITINMSAAGFSAWYNATGPNPFKLVCCYGRCNPWDGGVGLTQLAAGQTCVSRTISLACPTPAFTGGFPTCINAIAPSVPVTYTPNNYNAACTYTWTRSNLAWSITNAANGGVTINSISDANPCTFFLTVSSASCGTTVYTYVVNRNYNNAAILASPSPYCASTGSFTVNLASNAQGNQTCWSALPGGWSAVNPVGNPSAVQFTIPAAAAGTTANINLFSCACAGVTLPIVINVRPGTPVITGPQCVPSASAANQTWTATSAGANATAYNWNNTMGMTPQVAPTNDATGVFPASGTADGNVSVFTQNVPGCPSATTTFNVGRNAVAPIVVAPTCYSLGYSCAGVAGLAGTASFTIQGANFTQNGAGTYTWTFPANTFFNGTGSAVVVTQTTNTAVVRPTTGVPGNSVPTPPASYYQYTVCFTPAVVPPNLSPCASACTTFTATGVNLGTVFYSNNGTGTGTVGSLFPPAGLPGASTYFAYDCAIPGTYGSSVANPNPITLPTPVAVNSGSLTMQISVPGGCTWRPAPVVTSHKNMTVVDDNGTELTPAKQAESGITVMPNPNDGIFILSLRQEFLQGTVQLLDAEGKQTAAPKRLVSGNNQMSYTDLTPGTYVLRITLDGQVKTQRIVVTEVQ